MLIFLVLILFGVYFCPTFIGIKKKNSIAICLLNLFLGWTLVGWVVALVWASCKD
jgi:hypothetical protein